MTQPNEVTTLIVSTTGAPVPNDLQQKGAFVSQGGTTKAAGTLTLLSSVSDLTAILSGSIAITALAYDGLTHTVTGTATAHGRDPGDTEWAVVSGCTPAGYNGTFLATFTDANTFTYAMPSTLAACTVFGTLTDEDTIEINAMNTTFFAQGATQPVYVLELGHGTTAEGVTALNSFITTNPTEIYSYLVPRTWDGEATFKTMVTNYNAPATKLQFFVTTTISTYSTWTAVNNCVMAMVEAPGIPATEFSIASMFHRTLSRRPNSGTPVTTVALAAVYGVTPYPLFGNGATLQLLRNANIGYFDTGSEGGLNSVIICKWGHVLSGESFDKWYAIDWAAITLQQDVTNEVINGNNNTLAPLKYNQKGIDRLQNRAADTLLRGVTYGLLLGNVEAVQLDPQVFADNLTNGEYRGKCVINAIPFSIYTAQNPSDYAVTHQYSGLQAAIIPQLGFEHIVINLNASDFAG